MVSTNSVPIILASTSKYRQSLLKKLQLPFVCQAPDCDENHLPKESASDMSLRLAVEKAKSVAAHHKHGLVIGSDQTATILNNQVNNSILGKPGTRENAINQLLNCSGNTVRFFTGLSVVNAQTNEIKHHIEHFDVIFRELTEQQITRYIDKEKPFDCAGSFKSEGLGIALFSRLQGNDPNSLVGLPLISLCNLLNEFGVETL